MRITVILCTYNRCQVLARALASVARQLLPESLAWEVLVVDNNSSDQTREVVERFRRGYPGRFRYVFEAQQGLSNARNAGIRGANGDIVAFTDDDVIVEPTWLQNLTAGLLDGKWAGAGGRTVPEGTFSPPHWLSLEEKYALGPLAICDFGPEACELTETPFGNNMAFQLKVFETYGGFRTDLGRCGRSMLSNEDTEFGRRLLAAGERLRYEPFAIVYHPITESRIRKGYFLAWSFGKGRADVREIGMRTHFRWYVAGVPLVLFRRLAVSTLRWILTLDPPRRFSCKRSVWATAGEIIESYQQARNAKRQSRRSNARTDACM